uniref:Developmental pluripotency-associated protein 3 n=1 Tax=Castor canadensis TaxID=51338 RepID=A0A8B7U8Z9_CASCN|nr:developmental pluripotency-associated protein 3 [Castor canadensis]
MEPSQTFNPTLTAESFQMAYEENSPRDSAGSHPETLIRDLHNLTLNPPPRFPSPLPEGPAQVSDRSERVLQETRGDTPYRQRGVRTLLSARRERLAKMRALLSNRYSRSEPFSVPFQCTCSYCLYHSWDPSENARLGSDYDRVESI